MIKAESAKFLRQRNYRIWTHSSYIYVYIKYLLNFKHNLRLVWEANEKKKTISHAMWHRACGKFNTTTNAQRNDFEFHVLADTEQVMGVVWGWCSNRSKTLRRRRANGTRFTDTHTAWEPHVQGTRVRSVVLLNTFRRRINVNKSSLLINHEFFLNMY